MADKNKQDFNTQITVIGAGLVGGTLACALAKNGIDVVIVDKSDPTIFGLPKFDGRASAIAQASRKVLESVQLWELLEDKAEPILDIRVSDGNAPMFIHFSHKDVEDSALGYMVENRDLRACLKQLIENLGIPVLAPTQISKYDFGPKKASLLLTDGRQVSSDLIVAADGQDSPARKEAGIVTRGWPYKQRAIVATIEHELPHRSIAHEHFLPSGPFAILPLKGGHHSSLVWTEKASLVDSFISLPNDIFLQEIEERVGDFLGSLCLVGPRFSHSLRLQLAEHYIHRRLALVGDAAHSIHPIAGQGLNLGLRDVAALTEAAVDIKELGLDLANPEGLARYQRWRRADNLLMAGATDIINRTFSNDFPHVRLARDLGLKAVNHTPVLKRFFMHHAMGTVGQLPKMMRGKALM